MVSQTRVGWLAKYIAKHVRSEDDEDWDWYYNPVLHVTTVDDASLTPTGLVDQDGVPLWRLPNPIGFGRKFEW